MYNQLSIEICAVFALARHALISQEPAKARQLMQELMDNRGLEEQPVLNTTAELCHAYISLLTGRTDEVPAWLRNTDNAQTNLIFDGIGFTYIVAGRLLMMEQDISGWKSCARNTRGGSISIPASLGIFSTISTVPWQSITFMEGKRESGPAESPGYCIPGRGVHALH